MKKFFKILVVAAAVFATVEATAQTSVNVGYTGFNSPVANDFSGVSFGVDQNFDLGNGLGVAPGAFFSYAKSESSTSILGLVSASGKSEEMYLDIPVNFNYGIELSPAVRAFLFAGPGVSLGLASNYSISASAFGSSTSGDSDLYEDGDYGRFDVFVNGGVGLDLSNRFRIKGGYSYGLLNRIDGNDDAQHRSGFYVGLGLLF